MWIATADEDTGETDLSFFRHELDTIAQQVFDEVASGIQDKGSPVMADTPRTNDDELREEFRDEISGVRSEFRRDFKDLRGELVTAINTSQQLVLRDIDRIAAETAALRADTRADLDRIAAEITALRAESRSDVNALRAESRTDLGAFRSEVRDALIQLQQESRHHTVQIAEIQASIRTTTTILGVLITIVGVIAGVLGAIAAF